MTTKPLDRAGFSPRETYESYGFSRATFWKYEKLGKIKVARIGGRVIVPAAEFRRLGEEGLGLPPRRGAPRRSAASTGGGDAAARRPASEK